jgi:alpha-aminoadipate/glutamate carrier protein LysW
MATCPEWDAGIEVDEFDVDRDDQLSCAECGSNLEVIRLFPLELDLATDDDADDDEAEDGDEAEDSQEEAEDDDADDEDQKE